ncbi:MAG: hypothetical protein ACR2GH_18020 [Pseudonocardia sp.]
MRRQWESAAEFLLARHRCAMVDDIAGVEKLDEQLLDLAASAPDLTVTIMIVLSRSDDVGAREAVAIFVRYLFATRPEPAHELLIPLLFDSDHNIRSQALATLDVVSTPRDPTQTPALPPARLNTSQHTTG